MDEQKTRRRQTQFTRATRRSASWSGCAKACAYDEVAGDAPGKGAPASNGARNNFSPRIRP